MIGQQRGLVAPLVRFLSWPFVVLRIPPTAITLFSLVPAIGAAYFGAQREWAAGLLLGVVAGLLDVIDGHVARATDRVTAYGGYLDSVLDRVVDLALLLAFGFAFDSELVWFLVALCVVGSYGTSYAKARSFETYPSNNIRWGQFFERGERLVLIGLAAIAQILVEARGMDLEPIPYFLGVLAFGSLVSMLQRIVAVRRFSA